MKTTRVHPFVLIAAILLTTAGCGSPAAGPAVADSRLEGTVTISGAWALYPLVVRWAEEFRELHSGVRFDISAGGAGKGMADALAGAVDIGMVSRGIYPEEADKGAFWISVTKDAVFPTVSAQNPVWADLYEHGLSRDTLIGIFVTGEITTWGQAAGRPEVTDAIHVFTRSDACGAAATWAQFLGEEQEDLRGVAVYGDPGLLDAVIKDPLAIGFNNLNYAFDLDTGAPVAGARIVPVDADGNGRADPGEVYDTKEQAVEGVALGLYPSPPARDLNLVTPGKPAGLPAAFIRWILTDGQQFVNEAGYIALPASQLARELGKLD